MSNNWAKKGRFESATQLELDQCTIDRFLKKVVMKVWNAITSDYLEKLYESMPQQMAAVIAAGGGHTKYWLIKNVIVFNILVNKWTCL